MVEVIAGSIPAGGSTNKGNGGAHRMGPPARHRGLIRCNGCWVMGDAGYLKGANIRSVVIVGCPARPSPSLAIPVLPGQCARDERERREPGFHRHLSSAAWLSSRWQRHSVAGVCDWTLCVEVRGCSCRFGRGEPIRPTKPRTLCCYKLRKYEAKEPAMAAITVIP
jgi:hypothetical protein